MNRVLLLFTVIALYSCKSGGGSMDVYQNCPLEGDAKREDVRELNVLKNRYTLPDSTDFDHSVTLQSMLLPGNDHDRFSDRKAVDITGYVYDVKVGGDETCNCHERDPKYRDTHIELVLLDTYNEKFKDIYADKPKYVEKYCVIAEVTPRMREIMAEKGVNWETDYLQSTIKGHTVRIKGWLLFDEEHITQAENTDPDNPKDWRATCWEIHPITSIEILNNSGPVVD